MIALVGYTGFVGSNIYAAAGDRIGAVYNSKNIVEAYGTEPDLLIYAGLRAEKYLANKDPEKDMELICQAEENIARIAPERLVLISTIDVFKTPKDVDETTKVDTEGLHAYGYDRYQLEVWVRERYPDALIVRLPGLFGKGIKKNFIHDLMDPIPVMLAQGKMEELSAGFLDLGRYYRRQENGFYRVIGLDDREKGYLRDRFDRLGFSVLDFTDSRSRYQFYPLERLWQDIQIALREGLRLWHPATGPVSAGELYHHLTGAGFENELAGTPADYDCRTIHDRLFGGKDGYICDKEEIKAMIEMFVKREGQ